jgi:hypothetical protein
VACSHAARYAMNASSLTGAPIDASTCAVVNARCSSRARAQCTSSASRSASASAAARLGSPGHTASAYARHGTR